ncbi:MAG: hypothetical protein E6Q72_10345 [Pseudomonas sp.]|nr:MAG: hypothetical protein E6Q72_10345 [Pseudomonas sp.]
MTEGAPVGFGTHDHAYQCAHRLASSAGAVRRDKNQQATQRAWLVMFGSGTAGGLAWRRRSIPERHQCRPPAMTVRPEARPPQDSLPAAATWRL